MYSGRHLLRGCQSAEHPASLRQHRSHPQIQGKSATPHSRVTDPAMVDGSGSRRRRGGQGIQPCCPSSARHSTRRDHPQNTLPACHSRSHSRPLASTVDPYRRTHSRRPQRRPASSNRRARETISQPGRSGSTGSGRLLCRPLKRRARKTASTGSSGSGESAPSSHSSSPLPWPCTTLRVTPEARTAASKADSNRSNSSNRGSLSVLRVGGARSSLRQATLNPPESALQLQRRAVAVEQLQS